MDILEFFTPGSNNTVLNGETKSDRLAKTDRFGIKMALTIIMLVLYIFLVQQGNKAFIIITAIAYLIGLIVETYSFMHYLKHLEK